MIDIEKLCRKAEQTDAWNDNNAAYYALGCIKPNYPMPAINGVAEYHGDELTGEFWGIFIFNITEFVEDGIILASWEN